MMVSEKEALPSGALKGQAGVVERAGSFSSGGGRGRGWAEDLEPVPGGKHLILKSKLHACSPTPF